MFITQTELETHLYREQIDVISREDDAPILAAIDAAVQEAASYLGAYDCKAIFAAKGEQRNALLLLMVKDIAVWHFVNLCNAGVELDLREKRYNRAIEWLRGVQRGEVKPSLPIIDNNADGKPDGASEIIFGSNVKRTQHY